MAKIGIDFGTANCFVAAFINGKVQVFENLDGKRATPSCVRFTNYKRIVGNEAVLDEQSDGNEIIRDIKRILGRKVVHQFVSNFIAKNKEFHFDQDDNEIKVKATAYDDHGYTLEEAVAIILKEMKTVAESQLSAGPGKSVTITGAVITVPSSFDHDQRKALRHASVIAGLGDVRLINETTAVAVAYGFYNANNSGNSDGRNSLIFHLGAGSTDVTVARTHRRTIDILSHLGIKNLGGNDFDDNIVAYWIEKQIKKKKKVQRKGGSEEGSPEWLLTRKEELQLRKSSNEAKTALSKNKIRKTKVGVVWNGKDHFEEVTRDDFKQVNAEMLKSAFGLIEEALEKASTASEKIEEVVVVGGPTRVLKKLPEFESAFGKFAGKLTNRLNEDEAAVIGAAIVASELYGDKERGIVVHDVLDPMEMKHQTSHEKNETIHGHGLDVPPNDAKSLEVLMKQYRNMENGCEAVFSISKISKLHEQAQRMERDRERDRKGQICEREMNDLDRSTRKYLKILKTADDQLELAEQQSLQMWVDGAINGLLQVGRADIPVDLKGEQAYKFTVESLQSMIKNKKSGAANVAIRECYNILEQSLLLRQYNQNYQSDSKRSLPKPAQTDQPKAAGAISGGERNFDKSLNDILTDLKAKLTQSLESCEATLKWIQDDEIRAWEEVVEKGNSLMENADTLLNTCVLLAEFLDFSESPSEDGKALSERFEKILRRRLILRDKCGYEIAKKCQQHLAQVRSKRT